MASQKTAFEYLPERALIGLSLPRAVWAVNRPSLPNKIIVEIRSLLRDRMSSSQLDCFVLTLQQYFTKAVERSLIYCELKREAERRANEKGQPSRLSKKMGVQLRDSLHALIAVLENAQSRSSDAALEIILAEISKGGRLNWALDQLVTAELEHLMGSEAIDPLRRTPVQAAEHIVQAVSNIFQDIDRGIKTGREDVGMNCLVIAVAVGFQKATGHCPRRSYNPYSGKDSGIGLKICQILAHEWHAYLPANVRPRNVPQMAKTYRRVLDELLEDTHFKQ